MQHVTILEVTTGGSLATTGDAFSQSGTAGGSGGSLRYGVTLSGTLGSPAGWSTNTNYSTIGHIESCFAYGEDGTTNLRAWIGFSTQTITVMGSSSNPAGSYIGFRYDTSVPDTNWQVVTSDGSTINVLDSGVPPNGTSVSQTFAIVSGVGTSILFYIDGTLVKTVSTHLPTTSAGLRAIILGAPISSTGRQILIGGCFIFSDWP